MSEICYGCKLPMERMYIHPVTAQGYCLKCAQDMPLNPYEAAILLLTSPTSGVGPPFSPGDVVECRRAATIYEGIGVVREMSMDIKYGATPLYPMFRVELTEKDNDDVPDEAWYAEVSLTKVEQKEEAVR